MSEISTGRHLPRGPGKARRRSLSSDPGSQVRCRPLTEGSPLPLLVEPEIAGLDLVDWARDNPLIDEWLLEHRALLFRGFAPVDSASFGDFVAATSTGEKLEYRDRTTPRTNRGDRVYTSTVHPSDQTINPHNEGTYWTQWPQKLYLACIVAPHTGGATPIGDVRGVLARIPDDIVEEFEQKDWKLIRNFNDGFGLTWQEVFQTSDKEEVEDYCSKNAISVEWRPDGKLRTEQRRPAVRIHPRTKERVWFNHAAFFHWSTLDQPMQDELIRELGIDNLPYNTTYGDGTPIAPETAEVLRRAYEDEKVAFPWQVGDVVIIDNMSIYHAREPYEGDREILVAMADRVAPEM